MTFPRQLIRGNKMKIRRYGDDRTENPLLSVTLNLDNDSSNRAQFVGGIVDTTSRQIYEKLPSLSLKWISRRCNKTTQLNEGISQVRYRVTCSWKKMHSDVYHNTPMKT